MLVWTLRMLVWTTMQRGRDVLGARHCAVTPRSWLPLGHYPCRGSSGSQLGNHTDRLCLWDLKIGTLSRHKGVKAVVPNKRMEPIGRKRHGVAKDLCLANLGWEGLALF
jgi:hypothetical protein